MKRNTSQDPDYVGPTGHEKKFHKTHFGVQKEPRPGYKWDLQLNERGHWAWVEVPIVPKKRATRRTSAEVT